MISSSQSFLRNPRVGGVLRLAFSGLLLTLLFTQIDLESVLANLNQVQVRWFLPALGLYFVTRYLWAYQMSLASKPLGLVFALPRLFAIIFISSFYSLVLPGNVLTGGAISWYKLSRSNRKFVEVGALLIYLRLIDTLTLLGIGLVGMWFDTRFSSASFRAIVAAAFFGVILVSLPFFFPGVTRRLERFGQILAGRLPLPQWVRNRALAFWSALRAFQALEKRTIALIFGLSLVSHGLGIVLYYLLALAINMRISIVALGWIRSLVGIVQLLPLSVAGLGVREASLVLLLRQYGVSESLALTFSLAIFGLMVLGGLIGGALEIGDILFSRRGKEDTATEEGTDTDAPL
jgi:uncharacterized protein (TIRG00374 family)